MMNVALSAVRAAGQGLVFAALLALMLPVLIALALAVAAFDSDDVRALKH